jgi:hypothetical protein
VNHDGEGLIRDETARFKGALAGRESPEMPFGEPWALRNASSGGSLAILEKRG